MSRNSHNYRQNTAFQWHQEEEQTNQDRQYTKELPQSRSTAFPRYQKKWRGNKLRQNKIHTWNYRCCNKGTALERSVGNPVGTEH